MAVRMFGTVNKAKETKALGTYGAGVGGMVHIFDLLNNCGRKGNNVNPVKCGKSVFCTVVSMGLAVLHRYLTGAR